MGSFFYYVVISRDSDPRGSQSVAGKIIGKLIRSKCIDNAFLALDRRRRVLQAKCSGRRAVSMQAVVSCVESEADGRVPEGAPKEKHRFVRMHLSRKSIHLKTP